MNPNEALAWANLAISAEPLAGAFVKALLALRKKYPALTPGDLVAMIGTITGASETAFDDALAKIAADEAAHPHPAQ